MKNNNKMYNGCGCGKPKPTPPTPQPNPISPSKRVAKYAPCPDCDENIILCDCD